MKISTRTRYGTRLMLNLALVYGKGQVFLKDIAKQEGISEKYLSQIIIPLKAKGLVNSFRGAQGGYSLAKAPEKITLKEVVEVLEGGLNLVDEIKDLSASTNTSLSVVRAFWSEVQKEMTASLEAVTLRDLAKKYKEKDGKVLMYNI